MSSSSSTHQLTLPGFAFQSLVSALNNPPDDPLQALTKLHEPYKNKIDPEVQPRIYQGLIKKKLKFGEFYCPCKLQNTLENICPCVEFRETRHCHCELFK